MRAGFLIPTDLESGNIPGLNKHVTCAGFGAGKVAACSAAADLIFRKHCDTIIVWGLAGALSHRVGLNDIVIGTKVAYRDYDISPLLGSTGVGWVQNFSENVFCDLDRGLCSLLAEQVRRVFPDRNVLEGTVCTGDQFVELGPGDARNRVEAASDIVDMESAAVVHFCRNLNRNIRVGIVRVVSDNADHNANVDFKKFLSAFTDMNGKMYQLRRGLHDASADDSRILSGISNYRDFPVKGVLFKDTWGILADRTIFEEVCYRMYDLFRIRNQGAEITKVAGVESRGFLFGFELAGMLNVPFVPIRKKGKLPGDVVSSSCRTEYSECALEAQKSIFSKDDHVLLVDDIIATGGSLLAGKDAIEKCGASCRHCLALGQVGNLNGAERLRSHGLSADYLIEL